MSLALYFSSIILSFRQCVQRQCVQVYYDLFRNAFSGSTKKQVSSHENRQFREQRGTLTMREARVGPNQVSDSVQN